MRRIAIGVQNFLVVKKQCGNNHAALFESTLNLYGEELRWADVCFGAKNEK